MSNAKNTIRNEFAEASVFKLNLGAHVSSNSSHDIKQNMITSQLFELNEPQKAYERPEMKAALMLIQIHLLCPSVEAIVHYHESVYRALIDETSSATFSHLFRSPKEFKRLLRVFRAEYYLNYMNPS